MAVAKPTDGPISRYINRKLSYPISSLIVRKGVPISPNAMSVIALGSAVLAALALQLWPLMGSVLVQVSSILDGMDGEIARLRGIESKKGAFLDSMLDRLADISILLSLSLWAYRECPSQLTLLSSMLAVAGTLLVTYIHLRAPTDLGVHPTIASPTRGIAGRDVRLFSIFIGGLLGLPLETLVFLASLTMFYAIFNTIYLFSKR